MIKKLRRRLTVLVVGILILVSAGIVLSIHLVNLRNIEASALAALDDIAENGGRRPDMWAQAPEEGMPPPPDEDFADDIDDAGNDAGDDSGEGAVTPSDAYAADVDDIGEDSGDAAAVGDADDDTSGDAAGEAGNDPAAGTDSGVGAGRFDRGGMMGQRGELPGGDQLRGRGWRGELTSGTDTLATLSNFYTITLDSDGAVSGWNSDRSDLYTDEQIEAIAGQILAAGKSRGRADTQFYCLLEDEAQAGARRLIVLDARLEYLSARRVLRTTALVAALACLLLSLGACLLIRRMLKPVEASFERQKQFAWDASHELKTPLAVISANADVLSSEIGDNEYLGYIRSEVQRADKLVQNLLTLARMDKGSVQADIRRFDLSQALLSVALPFESTVFEAGKTLETDVPEGILCRGDEAMIQQLAVILLSNALKYSDDGGAIRLSLAQKGRGCVFSVYNTGSGIAPEHLEKIFDRFYREDASHNSEVSGNGLGLSIARTIAEANRGRIHAESVPGKSATFIVTLPG